MPSDKLRIAMLSVHSCPMGQPGNRDTGGMNVYIREMARALSEQGHMVDVYTRAHDPRDEQVDELAENARLIHIKAGRVEDMGKLTQYGHLDEFVANLQDFRRDNHLQYDLIHSHYWLSGEVGRRLGERWQVPSIIMFHTLGAVKNSLGVGEAETGLRLTMEGGLVGSCQRIITATERERRDLINYYQAAPEKIGVVPCGVNLDLFKAVDTSSARRQLNLNGGRLVLFVGRLEPLKGIDRLLKAVAYLEKESALKVLVIGGDEYSRPELRRLKRLSQDLGIADSVSFLGSVAQQKLPLFYSAADVCVVPSYYETFGLVALESLACGTPVVAADVGALSSIIRHGETGYLVAGNSPRRLAEKIELLFSRNEALSRSAGYIRDSVLKFSWSNIARAVLEEYRAVLSGYAAAA